MNNTGNNDMGLLALFHILSGLTGFGIFILIFFYIYKKETMSELELQTSKNLLNFHISFLIYIFISLITTFILIGFIGLIVFGIAYIIFGTIGFIKIINQEEYKFPWSIEFLK